MRRKDVLNTALKLRTLAGQMSRGLSFDRDDDGGLFEITRDLLVVIERYENLIKWFALKWDDQNPQFPEVDLVTGKALPENVQLSRTWYDVVRDGARCEVCKGAGYSRSVERGRDVVELTICVLCGGKGFLKF